MTLGCRHDCKGEILARFWIVRIVPCFLCLLFSSEQCFSLFLKAMFEYSSNQGQCSLNFNLKPCFPCYHFYSRKCFSLSLSLENVFLCWRTEEKHSINVLLSRIMSIKWSWLMLGVFWVFIIWLPPPLSSFRCHHVKHHTNHTNIHDRHHWLDDHHPAPHHDYPIIMLPIIIIIIIIIIILLPITWLPDPSLHVASTALTPLLIRGKARHANSISSSSSHCHHHSL